MGGGQQVLKRIPRIKFPERHPKSSSSGSTSQTQSASKDGDIIRAFISRSSDVPAAPTNTDVGSKASLQPKRTPVTEKEIEAVMLGGCL
ncbi:hypothetical protein SLA2020_469040 [Shorea laevis]